jgi:hypothetical protein
MPKKIPNKKADPRSKKVLPKNNKTGGRTAGTPNKVTASLREKMDLFSDDKFDSFVKSWEAMEDGKDKCMVYLKAQETVLPKLSSVSINPEEKEFETIEDIVKALKEQEAKRKG